MPENYAWRTKHAVMILQVYHPPDIVQQVSDWWWGGRRRGGGGVKCSGVWF